MSLAAINPSAFTVLAGAIAGFAAAWVVLFYSNRRQRAGATAKSKDTDASTPDYYPLILDTLDRSNVLLWWAQVTRHDSSYDWKIRTPPQLRNNPIYRLAALVNEGGLWKDEQAPEHERTKLTASAALARGDKGYQQEFPIIGLDGMHWLDEQVIIQPVSPEKWNLTGVIVDVTKRHEIEAKLREQNEILSKSHEGVMIVNIANEITLWNPGAEELFGWTAAEVLGRSPEQALGLDDVDTIATMRSAVESVGYWNGEMRWKHREGRKIVVEIHVTLVRDEKGQPRARLNFLNDITEKKLLEEKFLHAQRLETVGMLASGIAHDLNNVLAPIMFAETLLRESVSTPRDVKILETVKQCAARGAGLVKQILGFANRAAGERQPTQLKHIARDIVSVIEETFPKFIQLDPSIPADIWMVQGNATQIHQVLLNLCVNARDAMPLGGTLRFAVANRRLDATAAGAIAGARPGSWVMLEVADTGTGIAPQVLEHIWTPFFTTKGSGRGTGLGLSTVRGIVADHHGFIELQTEVGKGTTFRVYLPAVESEPSEAGSGAPFNLPDGRGELVLLADDDAPIRDIGTTILRRHGYQVLTCVDGVEAITAFIARADEIALAIIDVEMPRLGGAELARTISLIRPEVRLLAMSGMPTLEGDTSGVVEAKKVTHAFLEKPFTASDLLNTVRRLLDSAKNDTAR